MRGDVYELKAPRGTRGREQRGRRYAVIVQSDLLPLSTWLVAPTSTSARAASFRPVVEIAGRSTRVLVEQTASVDPSRLGRVVAHLSHHDIAAVDRGLLTVLGLSDIEPQDG